MEEYMYCWKCGTELQTGAVYCHKCGSKLIIIQKSNEQDVVVQEPIVQKVISQKPKHNIGESLLKMIGGFGALMVGIAMPVVYLLGIAIHIWTIGIAFVESGLIAAVISATTPVLSELYWGYQYWSRTGNLNSLYTYSMGIYILLVILVIVGFMIAEMKPKKNHYY